VTRGESTGGGRLYLLPLFMSPRALSDPPPPPSPERDTPPCSAALLYTLELSTCSKAASKKQLVQHIVNHLVLVKQRLKQLVKQLVKRPV
jgi:hypothetical protein